MNFSCLREIGCHDLTAGMGLILSCHSQESEETAGRKVEGSLTTPWVGGSWGARPRPTAPLSPSLSRRWEGSAGSSVFTPGAWPGLPSPARLRCLRFACSSLASRIKP